MPSINDIRAKGERKKSRLIAKVEREVAALYDKAAADIAALLAGVPLSESAPLSKYPHLEKRVSEITDAVSAKAATLTQRAILTAWSVAEDVADEMESEAYKGATPDKRRADAAAQYLARDKKGLNLSHSVWNITEEGFNKPLRTALSLGITEGRSAAQLSREIRHLLKNPTALFRRVRDKEKGLLRPSKAMAAYHPGRGVYRSAYKNARRLAATETNIAYRTADYQRLQAMDFVVGVRIVLSNNHTCLNSQGKAERFTDICDDLQGDYPKDFKFTGWHPHCRCHVETILKTDEELAADTARLLNGEPPITGSANEVSEPPEAFKAWCRDNAQRIKEAKRRGTLPYFIKDNEKRVKAYTGEARKTQKAKKVNAKKREDKTAQLTPNKHLKTNYADIGELADTINKINADLPTANKWLKHGDIVLQTTTRSGVNGMTTQDGKIWLTPDRMAKVTSAFEKIAQGKSKTITEQEADAMATLWHEITHNRKDVAGWKSMTDLAERRMELANEFVARNTLNEFYEALGAENPHPKFCHNRGSTGYNNMVRKYDHVIKECGLDREKVADTVKSHLFGFLDHEQTEGIKKGLRENGLCYVTGPNKGKPIRPKDLTTLIKRIENDITLFRDIKDEEQKLTEFLKAYGLLL